MQIFNQQWLDENSDRAYPLVDAATRLDTGGVFTLPNDLVVDARISAPSSLDGARFFISRTSAYGSGLVLTIAVDGVGDVASVTVPLANFSDYSAFAIAPLPGYNVSGTMVIGNGASAIAAGSGSYTFTLAATRFLPTVIYPGGAGVTSITFRDGFGVDSKLTGDVVLAAGDNTAVSVSGQTITIGMTTGVVIDDPCPCVDAGGRDRTAVKSVNGVTPDSAGNLTVIPVGCVGIGIVNGQLQLQDNCATPCCGTPEIQTLTDAVNNIQAYLATLANGSAALESAVRNLQAYLAQ